MIMIRTYIYRPPIEFFWRLESVRIERFLGHLTIKFLGSSHCECHQTHVQQLMWPHLAFIHPTTSAIDSILAFKLDVEPYTISFARYNHAGTIIRMYSASVANVGEIGLRNHVDNAPDIVCLFALHGNAEGFTDPRVSTWTKTASATITSQTQAEVPTIRSNQEFCVHNLCINLTFDRFNTL